MTNTPTDQTENNFENTNETINALIDCLAVLSEQLIMKGVTPATELTTILDTVASNHFQNDKKDAAKAIWQLNGMIKAQMSKQALKHIPPSGRG